MPVDSSQLSVVIPTCDTRGLTLACLASVEAARRSEMEVLVVDDASGDGTAEAVREQFSGSILLVNQERRGFGPSANRGLEAASGEILLVLNSDTEVDPAGLEALREGFESEPEAGVIGGALRFPDGRPQWSGGGEPSLTWLFVLATGWAARRAHRGLRRRPSGSEGGEVEWVTGAALAMRRPVWRDLGPFDEDFAFYGQDLDLCHRARRSGWKVLIWPGFGVIHRLGSTISKEAPGESQRLDLLWTDLLRFLAKTRGSATARRARWVMALGARLALLGLAPASRRPEVRRALEALGSPSGFLAPGEG